MSPLIYINNRQGKKDSKEEKEMRSKRTKRAKMTKKTTALMLSAVMSTVWAGTAFAEPVNIPMETVSGPGDNTTMTLTGVVKVTTLKVTIPTAVTFDIDMTAVPSAPAAEDTTAAAKMQKVKPQVGQPDPDVYKITNQSASSVWVYVNEVSVEGDAGGTAPTLVTAYETMFANPNNVMFTLKDAKDDSTPLTVTGTEGTNMKIGTEGADGDWMVAGSKDYYLNANKGKLVAADQATSMGKENEMGLRIYAYTRKGWQAGNSFKVKPVFTVSVTEPGSAT